MQPLKIPLSSVYSSIPKILLLFSTHSVCCLPDEKINPVFQAQLQWLCCGASFESLQSVILKSDCWWLFFPILAFLCCLLVGRVCFSVTITSRSFRRKLVTSITTKGGISAVSVDMSIAKWLWYQSFKHWRMSLAQ